MTMFATSERVRTGIGKGTKGIGVSLTPKGYAWLGTKPHMMRGNSSIEHSYWCTTIARHLDQTIIGSDVQKPFLPRRLRERYDISVERG